MSHMLECQIFFDSTRHAEPPAGCGDRIDLAVQPEAAAPLERLGICPKMDLPAMLLSEPDGKVRIVGVRLTGAEAERLADGVGIHAQNLVIYSSSWCSDCRRMKRVLEDAEARFDEVNIDQDAGAEAVVLARSGGRRVVPTLRFDDRMWAFNPAPPLLRRLLHGRATRPPQS